MDERETPQRRFGVAVDVDCTALDEAIEKTNRLVELLREVATIIDSLSLGVRSDP